MIPEGELGLISLWTMPITHGRLYYTVLLYCMIHFCFFFILGGLLRRQELIKVTYIILFNQYTKYVLGVVDHVVMGTVIQEVRTSNIAREVSIFCHGVFCHCVIIGNAQCWLF